MPAIFPRPRRCKAMHDRKVMDFNPLDLLATAAALKSNGPDDIEENDEDVNEKNNKNLKTKIGDKKVDIKNGDSDTVMTKECKNSYDSDVDKMLDEHNYGNARQKLNAHDYIRVKTNLQTFEKTDVDENLNEKIHGSSECSCQTDDNELESTSDGNDENNDKIELNDENSHIEKALTVQATVNTPVHECDNLNNIDTKPQVKQLNEACSINRHEINLPCELGVTEHTDTSQLNITVLETGKSTLQQAREISEDSNQCNQTEEEKKALVACTHTDIKCEESRAVKAGEDKLVDCDPWSHDICDIDQSRSTVNCQLDHPISEGSSQIEDISCKGDNCDLFDANNAPNECSIMRSLLTGHKGMLENRNSEILENTGLCTEERSSFIDSNIDKSTKLKCAVDEDSHDSVVDTENDNTPPAQHFPELVAHTNKLSNPTCDTIPSINEQDITICDKNKDTTEVVSVKPNFNGNDEKTNEVNSVMPQCHVAYSSVSIRDEHSYAGCITSHRVSVDECLDTDTEMSSQDENTTSSNLFTSQLSEDSGLCLSSPCDESSFSEFPNNTLQAQSEINESLSGVSPFTPSLLSPIITAPQSDSSNSKYLSVKSPIIERPQSYSVSSFECPVSPAQSVTNVIPSQETPKKTEISPISPVLLYQTPTKSPTSYVSSAGSSLGSPKIGSYRIGTFGSISNSSIDDKSSCDTNMQLKIAPPVKQKSALKSPIGNVIPSSSQSLPPAWKKSLLHAKLINSSPPVLNKSAHNPPVNHISHDHDYCSRVFNKNIVHRETIVNSKPSTNHDVKQSSMMQTIDRLQQSLKLEDNKLCLDDNSLQTFKPTAGRPRSKSILAIEDCKDLDTAAKMRITGSYQNQYVYFLNKKSRSRRRTNDSSNKVSDLAKAYKGSEIIIPHLSDADLEALKEGKSLPSLSTSFPVSSALMSTSDTFTSPPAYIVQPTVSTENITDEKIINTILSMETEEMSSGEECAANSVHSGNIDGLGSIADNLTPEQMEVLFNAMAEVAKDMHIDSPDNDIEGNNSVSVPSETAITCPAVDKTNKLISSELEVVSDERSLSDHSKWLDCDTQTSNDQSLTTKVPLSVHPVTEVSQNVSISNSSLTKDAPDQSSHQLTDVSCVFSNMEKNNLLTDEHQKACNSVNENVVDSDNASPMIVTVNMFWNDLPALMFDDNKPYVRLVDIHKQILPAKDTGILKKRCQLLHIEVKNCSEMQRYFLVQYGRAFNSKSTLIVSKDDAKNLIGYYVNPIPRPPRSEFSGTKVHRMDSEHLRQAPSAPVNKRSEMSKKIIKARLPPSSDGKYTTTSKVSPMKTSKVLPSMTRTRHKKINFLEMLRGETSAELEDLPSKENSSESVNQGIGEFIGHKVNVEQSPSLPEVSRSLEVQNQLIKETKKKCSVYGSSSNVQDNVIVKDDALELQVRTDSPNRTSKSKLLKSKSGKLKSKSEKSSKSEKKQVIKRSDNSTSLLIVHRDANSTNGHRGKFQSGRLLLHLFKNINSLCIQCVTCDDMFSLAEFQKHQHENKNCDRLIESVGERRIEPQNVNLSASERRLWVFFVKKKEYLLLNMRSKKQKLLSGSENTNKLRESPRKRKIKQLYPIEDFSFSKRRNIEFVKTNRGTTSDCANKVLSKSDCENVVTLQNGPELTSFTALEDLF